MDDQPSHAALFQALGSGTAEDRGRFVVEALAGGGLFVAPTMPGQRLCLREVKLIEAGLRGADFHATDMAQADLSGADAAGANFAGATLRGSVFKGARLESAGFKDADLSGADLSGVAASEAVFAGALAEDTRFNNAVLRFTVWSDALLDGTNLDGADLWSAQMDGITASGALFRGTNLQEARLPGADLSGAKFEGAELQKVDLSGARLVGADLRGATLARADLSNANLSGALLPRVDLSTCVLRGARLAGAWLESTRMTVEQISGGIGEEADREYGPARQGYLALEQNFRSLGNPEAASWCYRKARRMGRRQSAATARDHLRARRLRPLPQAFLTWFGDAFAEWLCDYGESLPRVVRAYLVTLTAFAVFYGVTDSLRYTGEASEALTGLPVHDPVLLAGFSFLNMCTSGVPDIGLKPSQHLVYFVSSMQYVVGVVLVGLFGYVLGNRLRR